MNDDLRKALSKTEARTERYDTMMIANAWVALARAEPNVSLTTHKGLAIVVGRVPHNIRVKYLVTTAGWRKQK